MRFILLVLLSFSALANSHEDPHSRRWNTPAYLGLATGSLNQLAKAGTHAWPVRVQSIGHTNASYQRYGFGTPYFHHGLDIRADAGEAVYASAGGKVVNIENYDVGPSYWEVAILDDRGFLWQYHHVDKNSITPETWAAFRSGGRVEAGAKIGEVVYWEVVSYGERYNHIHLNVLDGQRRYVSPFLFLQPLPDRDAPKVVKMGLLKNGQAVAGQRVRAPYTVYAEIADLILHPRFIVPPHMLAYSLNGGPLKVVWNFETLPGGADEEARVHEFFVPSLVCGNYNCRRQVIDLGFNWPLPQTPGTYQLRLQAYDFAGNLGEAEWNWTVE